MSSQRPIASATWVESTGQIEWTVTLREPDRPTMSGQNLNDGTAWDESPIYNPGRFGSCQTPREFYAWIERFVAP